MEHLLEVCAADIDSVMAAAKGGATRIELCSALLEGGLTPSYGMIEEAMKVPGIKVNVLIRPRTGDFLYNDAELRVMRSDIELCRRLGVNGVVFGVLTPDGEVDKEACRMLISAAKGLHMTFHRAFDMCRDPHEAAATIRTLGFDRILTSGQAANALSGADTIATLQKEFPELTFIAAAGISPENVREIISRSGVREVHASARNIVPSLMRYRHQGVSMGTPGADEYSRSATSASVVAALTAQLSNTVQS